MPRLLVLNGSPRKDGTVATLLKAVVEGLPSGWQRNWVDASRLQMAPCSGCMECRRRGECVLPEDDAHRVGRQMLKADGLLVGTPTHWGNMSAPLKLLLDRNVPRLMAESEGKLLPWPRQKGKPAALVCACAAPWPISWVLPEGRGALRAVRHVLGHGGYRIVGSVVKSGTKGRPEIEPSVLEKARRLGRRFA